MSTAGAREVHTLLVNLYEKVVKAMQKERGKKVVNRELEIFYPFKAYTRISKYVMR